MPEQRNRPPPVADLRRKEHVFLEFLLQAPGGGPGPSAWCCSYPRHALVWGRLQRDIATRVYGVTPCGNEWDLVEVSLTARPLPAGADQAAGQAINRPFDAVPDGDATALIRMADRDAPNNSLAVQVLVPPLPAPKPETLRLWVHRASGSGLDRKRCLEARAQVLYPPPQAAGQAPEQVCGLRLLLRLLGLESAPREQCRLRWAEQGTDFTEDILRERCERVRARQPSCMQELNLIVGEGECTLSNTVTK